MGQIKEYLLVLKHFTGGGPARGPEVLSIQYQNTAYGGIWNQMINQGLMLFITIYHKGYSSSGRAKIIHQYVPREVGELFMYF
jgi:hypothetical protein